MRSTRSWLAENDENCAPRFKTERHCSPVVGDLERRRLDDAGIGVPKFRFLALDAKGRLHNLRLITAIVDEIQIAIFQDAVYEFEFRAAC